MHWIPTRTRPEPDPRSQNPRPDSLDVGDAVGPVLSLRVEVSVRERHEPPAHCEEQPAADEGGGEDDEREAPLEVHQRGEDVLQEAALLADVGVRHVAHAVLGHEARLARLRLELGLQHILGQACQQVVVRNQPLPGQHSRAPVLRIRGSASPDLPLSPSYSFSSCKPGLPCFRPRLSPVASGALSPRRWFRFQLAAAAVRHSAAPVAASHPLSAADREVEDGDGGCVRACVTVTVGGRGRVFGSDHSE